MTRWPARCRWRMTTSCTRLPKCSDGAVGSKPQYAVIGPSASASRSADSSVVWATSPRHCSSSRMSLTVGCSFGGRYAGCAGVPGGRYRSVGTGDRLVPAGQACPMRRRAVRRGFAGRYTETVGSPSSQNLHGYAAASPPAPATPTRGPVRTAREVDVPRRRAEQRRRCPARRRRARCARRTGPACVARRAGPRAQSRSAMPAPARRRHLVALHHLPGPQQDSAGVALADRRRRWRTSACRR